LLKTPNAGTGHFLRSAEMEYISLIMAEHLSHDVLTKLGEIGVVQFTDVSAKSCGTAG
jgi:vacuolar-type H+-ATPase subunit I/STV1